jgi:hypothetical protein
MRFLRLAVCLGAVWMVSTGFDRQTIAFDCRGQQTTICGNSCPDVGDCPAPATGCKICATQCNASKCIACNEVTLGTLCEGET